MGTNPPPGSTTDQLKQWACTYIRGDAGGPIRQMFVEGERATFEPVRDWFDRQAIAVDRRGGQVQVASGLEKGWKVEKCPAGPAGRSCRFLKDKGWKVTLPRSAITFACTPQADSFAKRREGWGRPNGLTPTEFSADLCYEMKGGEDKRARAARLRSHPAHRQVRTMAEGAAVAARGETLLVADHLRYGWEIVSCPQGDAGNSCRGLMRHKAVTLPTKVEVASCAAVPKRAMVPRLPPLRPDDDRPWRIVRVEPALDRIIDIDTLVVERDGRQITVRVAGINGPECKGYQRIDGTNAQHYRQRCENGEWGALQGHDWLTKWLKDHGNQVYLAIYGEDHYHRAVATVFVKDKKGDTVDLAAEALRSGWALPFFFAPDELRIHEDYTPIYVEAKRRGLGLHTAKEEGAKRYRGPLYISSYHPQIGVEKPDPSREYARIINIGVETIDLAGFYLEEAVTGERFPLPSMMVPVGFNVQVFTSSGRMQADPNVGPLTVNLGRGAGIWWHNDLALLLKRRGGGGEDVVVSAIGSAEEE